MSRHVEQHRETEQLSDNEQYLRERVEELEDEIINLKIDKQAREQVIK
jgi:cell division protein FtsB